MLTQAHARALRDNSSASVRAEVAAAVAAEFASRRLAAEEARIAQQILDVLVRDVELRVRQALAEHVKECPFLPREIALTLARDIDDSVAVPILEHSPLLTDCDLVAWIRDGVAARRVAVARRKAVAPVVADALVATADAEVAATLLGNAGAEISEGALLKLAGLARDNPSLGPLLIERPMLPLAVCEALIASVSDQLRERLVVRHRIPPALAEELAMHGRERAVAEILPRNADEAASRLAAHLHRRRRLTPTLVLRSLLLGDLCFFDAAMATLAGVPIANARTLLYGRDGRGRDGGLAAIYQRAGLPPYLFPALRVGVASVLDGHIAHGRSAYTQRVLDQLVLTYDEVSPAGVEHMLAQLSRRNSAGARGAGPVGRSPASAA
jgi:uncharacterized protein (DUF2336 family)